KCEAAVDRGRRQVGDEAAGEALAGREMKGDVAAIVDVRFGEAAAFTHRGEEMIGDGAGDGGHRRDEAGAVGPAGSEHAASDGAMQSRRCRTRPPLPLAGGGWGEGGAVE